jgi:hypothetical protein
MQGVRATFSKEDVTEIRFKPDNWAVITVHRFHGLSWIYLPILPFILFHESLHLIIVYFTPREVFVRYIPPVLDLFYLPVAFWIAFIHPTVSSLLVGDFICLVWFYLLIGNLKGDFRPMPKLVEKPGKPEYD